MGIRGASSFPGNITFESPSSLKGNFYELPHISSMQEPSNVDQVICGVLAPSTKLTGEEVTEVSCFIFGIQLGFSETV